MADTIVTLSGDEANLYKSFQRIIDQQNKTDGGYKKLRDSSVKASDDAAAAQAKVTKAFETQLSSIDLQIVALQKGKGEAVEMKAIAEGLSKEQAKLLRLRHEELDALEKQQQNLRESAATAKQNAAEAVRLEKQKKEAADQVTKSFDDQVKAYEREIVTLKKGKAVAVELKAVHQGMTQEQAKRLAGLQREVDLHTRCKNELQGQTTLVESLISSAAPWAAGLFTVAGAIEVVGNQQRELNKLQEESLRLSLETAKAQSGASQNLTGLSTEDKAKALNSANEIQAKTGFVDKKQIIEAIGASYNITNDLETTTAAIEAAAPLAAHSPENLKELTRSGLSVQRMTGVKSIEDSLGFLQNAAGVAFVDNNAAVAKNLTPILATAVAGAPTQDAKEASSQAAAIFGKVTQDKQDPLGDTSRVAADKFIRTLASVSQSVTAEITKLDEQIAPLVGRQRITNVEKAQQSRADININEKQRIADQMGNRTDYKAIDARADLEEAKAQKVKLLESVTLDELDTNKLKKLQEQRQGLSAVKDSGTIFGRMEAAQSNTALRELVLDKLGNDESRTVYENLLRKENQAGLVQSANTVQFDRKAYDQQVKEERSLTPQLAIATLDNKAKGFNQVQTETFDRSSASKVREIVNDAIANNPSTGWMGFMQGAVNKISATTGMDSFTSNNPDQMIDQGINRLKQEQNNTRNFSSDETKAEDQTKIANLDKSIELLEELRAIRKEQQTTNALMIDRNKIIEIPNTNAQERQRLPKEGPVLALDPEFAEFKKLGGGKGQVDEQEKRQALEKQDAILAELKRNNALMEEQNKIARDNAPKNPPKEPAPQVPPFAIRNNAGQQVVVGAQ